NHYEVNFHPDPQDPGATYQFTYRVAGLDIGTVTAGAAGAGSVAFQVDNHPVIRTRVLHVQGYSASQVAVALQNEFGLGAGDVARLEANDAYKPSEVGQGLKTVFGLSAASAAQTLKDAGFGGSA